MPNNFVELDLYDPRPLGSGLVNLKSLPDAFFSKDNREEIMAALVPTKGVVFASEPHDLAYFHFETGEESGYWLVYDINEFRETVKLVCMPRYKTHRLRKAVYTFPYMIWR